MHKGSCNNSEKKLERYLKKTDSFLKCLLKMKNTKCSNKKVSDSLPEYYANNLSENERSAVGEHLKTCKECRNQLKNIRLLAESLAATETVMPSGHPDSEKLILFAESRQLLPEKEIIEIGNHLQNCKTCSEELNILQKVNSSNDNRKGFFQGIIPSFINNFNSTFFLRPVFTYSIIILMLYPAWKGIFNTKTDSPTPVSIQKHYTLVDPGQRSGSGADFKLILKPSEKFTLSAVVPVNLDKYQYTAVVKNNENESLWSNSNIKPVNDYGLFMIVFTGRFFDEDSYTLQIIENNPETGNIEEEYRFPFIIDFKHR